MQRPIRFAPKTGKADYSHRLSILQRAGNRPASRSDRLGNAAVFAQKGSTKTGFLQVLSGHIITTVVQNPLAFKCGDRGGRETSRRVWSSATKTTKKALDIGGSSSTVDHTLRQLADHRENWILRTLMLLLASSIFPVGAAGQAPECCNGPAVEPLIPDLVNAIRQDASPQVRATPPLREDGWAEGSPVAFRVA